MQLDDLADGMAKVMFAEIERACSPLLQRIATLESQIKELPAGQNGADGKDADPKVIRAAVAEAVAALPPAKDGTSVTLDEVAPLVADAVKAAVAEIPVPVNGADGKDAPPIEPSDIVKAILSLPEIIDEAVQKHLTDNPPPAGKDGADGKDADEAAIRADIPSIVQRALEALPKPQDGRDGRDGLPGLAGVNGEKGADGINGKDGRDALDLDDFEIRGTDDPRVCMLALRRGEAIIERELRIPCVIDRGVFKAGSDYAHGDGVTWGGSWWIAQKDHPQGKPGENNDFRLAVKKGRDGRDGAPGKDYVPVVVKVS